MWLWRKQPPRVKSNVKWQQKTRIHTFILANTCSNKWSWCRFKIYLLPLVSEGLFRQHCNCSSFPFSQTRVCNLARKKTHHYPQGVWPGEEFYRLPMKIYVVATPRRISDNLSSAMSHSQKVILILIILILGICVSNISFRQHCTCCHNLCVSLPIG